MDFSFRFVKGGNLQGLFFNSKARLGPEGLLLGKDLLPLEAIRETTTRDDNVVLALDPMVPICEGLLRNQDEGCLVLRIAGVEALSVERNVDRLVSAASAERRRAKLQAEGRGHLFRAERCPNCGAVMDLSEMPRSAYVHCRFCESVLHDATLAVATRGETHRPCDECHMFDRVKGYTEFYFYFLLVVYGFSSRRRHMCDTCAGRLFWKVLLLNLPFVLGIPSALALKAQSMMGRDPALGELAQANALARTGRMDRAGELFARVHARIPQHPGVLLNEAMGCIAHGDAAAARTRIEKALAVCPNYGPAQRFWLALQLATGAPVTPASLPWPVASAPEPERAPAPVRAAAAPTDPDAAAPEPEIPRWAALGAAAEQAVAATPLAIHPGAPVVAGGVSRLPSSASSPESVVRPVGSRIAAPTTGMSLGRKILLAVLISVMVGLGAWLYVDHSYRTYNADAIAFLEKLSAVEERFRHSVIHASREPDAAARARVQEAVRQLRIGYDATASERKGFRDRYGHLEYASTKFLLGACDSMDAVARLPEGQRLDPRDATLVTFQLRGAMLTLHYVNEHMVDWTKPPQSVATDQGAAYYTQQSWGGVNLDRL